MCMTNIMNPISETSPIIFSPVCDKLCICVSSQIISLVGSRAVALLRHALDRYIGMVYAHANACGGKISDVV